MARSKMVTTRGAARAGSRRPLGGALSGVGAFLRAGCGLLAVCGLLAGCGPNESDQDAATGKAGIGERVHGTKAADVDIPEGKSRIRTIVGEVLEKRDDAVGEWARKKSAQRAEKRKTQTWLQPIDYDFGKQRVGKKLKAELTLQNPSDVTKKITGLSKSCTCQRVILVKDGKRLELSKGLKQPIEFAPGEKAVVEAHVEVPDRQSRLSVAVRIETDDKDFPVLDAQLHVEAVRDIVVHVGEERRDTIDLGELTEDSKRDFEFRVATRDKKPVVMRKVLGSVPAGMKVKFERLTQDGSEWLVRGVVGPDLGEDSLGGTVQFDTDRGKFGATVYWRVKPPVEIKPGNMLVFGVIPRTKGSRKALDLRCIDPSDRLRVERVEFFDVPKTLLAAGSKFEAKITHGEDGRSAKVDILAPKGLRRGRFHIGAVLHFGGGKLSARKVRVIGHVR